MCSNVPDFKEAYCVAEQDRETMHRSAAVTHLPRDLPTAVLSTQYCRPANPNRK